MPIALLVQGAKMTLVTRQLVRISSLPLPVAWLFTTWAVLRRNSLGELRWYWSMLRGVL